MKDFFVETIKEVVEWNAVARPDETFDDERIRTQSKFVIEELRETLVALLENNVVEYIDGLCDTLVTMGYLYYLQCGGVVDLEIEENFVEVLEDSESYSQYDLIYTVSQMLFDIDKGFSSCYYSMESLMILFYLLEKKGVDVRVAMREVLDSNWSKYPSNLTTEQAIEEAKWIASNKDMGGVDYKFVGDRVIFFNSDGKIMKPSTFKGPVINKPEILNGVNSLF